MSRKVACNRDQDVPPGFRIGPFVELAHPGFKNLISVKSRILTQQRMRQAAMIDSGGWPNVRWRATRRAAVLDPVLPIESVQQCGADFLDC